MHSDTRETFLQRLYRALFQHVPVPGGIHDTSSRLPRACRLAARRLVNVSADWGRKLPCWAAVQGLGISGRGSVACSRAEATPSSLHAVKVDDQLLQRLHVSKLSSVKAASTAPLNAASGEQWEPGSLRGECLTTSQTLGGGLNNMLMNVAQLLDASCAANATLVLPVLDSDPLAQPRRSRHASRSSAYLVPLRFDAVFDFDEFRARIRPCAVTLELPSTTMGLASGVGATADTGDHRRSDAVTAAPPASCSRIRSVGLRPLSGNWSYPTMLRRVYAAVRPSETVRELISTLRRQAERLAGPRWAAVHLPIERDWWWLAGRRPDAWCGSFEHEGLSRRCFTPAETADLTASVRQLVEWAPMKSEASDPCLGQRGRPGSGARQLDPIPNCTIAMHTAHLLSRAHSGTAGARCVGCGAALCRRQGVAPGPKAVLRQVWHRHRQAAAALARRLPVSQRSGAVAGCVRAGRILWQRLLDLRQGRRAAPLVGCHQRRQHGQLCVRLRARDAACWLLAAA